MKTAFLMSRIDKTNGINKPIATNEHSDDFQLNYGILDAANHMVATVALNIYKDTPEVRNEQGQLLYHWDDDNGSGWDELQLVLDAYKASEFWEKYPLVL